MILINQNVETTVIIIKAECFIFLAKRTIVKLREDNIPKDSLKTEILIYIQAVDEKTKMMDYKHISLNVASLKHCGLMKGHHAHLCFNFLSSMFVLTRFSKKTSLLLIFYLNKPF